MPSTNPDRERDQKEIAVNITHLFFKTPSYRKTIAYLLLVSFALGILFRYLTIQKQSLAELLIFGSGDGFFVIALPAIVSSLLATFLMSRKQFRFDVKYFAAISLVSAIVYGVVLNGALILSKIYPIAPNVQDALVVLANAIVLIIWLVSTWVALSFRSKAALTCWLHPVANIAFIVLWSSFNSIAPYLPSSFSPLLTLLNLLIASLILVLAVAAVFKVTNAPAQRNFGISTIDAATLFFAQWVKQDKGLEDLLAETGTNVTTHLSTVAFKRLDGSLKGVFVTPQIHYGPFGNIGGSEFPHLISRKLEAELRAPVLVFKGAANHDFNPVHSSSHLKIAELSKYAVNHFTKLDYSSELGIVTGDSGTAHLFGFELKGKAFLTLSRAPHTSDDIDTALGLSLAHKAESRGFSEVAIIDRHNSKPDNYILETGSKEYFELEDAVGSLTRTRPAKFKLGLGHVNPGLPFESGIGEAGVKTVVFEVTGRKHCLVLIDANNIEPTLRLKVLDRIKRDFDFDFVDLFTTDTHSVNMISGVHNPLGTNITIDVLYPHLYGAIEHGLDDLETVSGAMKSERFEIEVLGSQRVNEMMSTFNSVIAIMKILAPVIFIGSIVLAFAALIFLHKLT